MLNRGKYSVEENVIIRFHIFNPYFSQEAKEDNVHTLVSLYYRKTSAKQRGKWDLEKLYLLEKRRGHFIIKRKFITRVPGFTFALRKWQTTSMLTKSSSIHRAWKEMIASRKYLSSWTKQGLSSAQQGQPSLQGRQTWASSDTSFALPESSK